MAVNTDPKPGRWILPLVVLGMVAFTYFFVQNLPGGGADDDAAGGTTTTTTGDNGGESGDGGDDGSATTTTVPLDPAVEQYLQSVEALGQQLQTFQTEMTAVNQGFDADPREIEFGEAVERLTTLSGNVSTWAESVGALTAPPGFEQPQADMATAAATAADEAAEVLAQLESPNPAEDRRAAVARFDEAVADFDAAAAAAEALAVDGAGA